MQSRAGIWSTLVAGLGVLLSLYGASSARAQGTVLEARGEASYSVPIVVPPGPAGHQPNLELVYNSGEGKGPAGWLGFGWSLAGESRIERDTRTGTPYDFDNVTCGSGYTPCYREAFVLDGQDLVCNQATCTPCTSGTTSDSCRYRTQSDDGRQIYYLGETGGWKIRDREGRTLIYGAATSGRLVNAPISKVFSWQLESSTDVNSNVIAYQWDTASDPNVAYLQRVTYGDGSDGDRSVDFILSPSGARPDKPVSARSGFRQQITRRVTEIVVKASNQVVTSYELSYTQDPDSTRSRLTSVQRLGNDGSAPLPPYEFDYSERGATAGFTAEDIASFNSGCLALGGQHYTEGLSDFTRMTLDLNRDGLSDLIQHGDVTTSTMASLGDGTRFIAGASACDAQLTSAEWHAKSLELLEKFGNGAVMDLDGDGFPDSHHKVGVTGGSAPTGFRLGSASGFIEPPYATLSSFELPGWSFYWGSNPGGVFPTFSETDPYLNGGTFVTARLTDVTADGRPDMVFAPLFNYSQEIGGVSDPSWATWDGWAVFVNRGWKTDSNGTYLNFSKTPLKWPSVPGKSISHVVNSSTYTTTADVNGDGLPDLLWNPGGGANQLSLGYGAGFLASYPITGSIGGSTLGCTYSGHFDINGDGLLDFILAAQSHWDVWFGTGEEFRSVAVSFPAPDVPTAHCLNATGNSADGSVSLVDVDGDGVFDYLHSVPLPGGGVLLNLGARNPEQVVNPDLAQASLPGLLIRATDPLGGVVEFTYKGVPQFKDANGSSASPGYGLTKPVVSRVRYLDGRLTEGQSPEPLTPPIITTYHYAGAVFDYTEKEFRGFGTVTATLVEAGQTPTTVITTRRTDRECPFAMSAREVLSGTTVLTRESIEYLELPTATTTPSQFVACLPSVSLVESVEGSESTKKVNRTSWNYGADPIALHYNVQSVTESGEWNVASGVDVPGDERLTTYVYAAASTVPGIVSRVREMRVRDTANNTVSWTRNCYTTNCLLQIAASGKVLKVQRWLADPTADPPISPGFKTVASFVYDGYGNLTMSTGASTPSNPNGLQTLLGYDETYHTFPVTVTQMATQPLVTTMSYAGCASGSFPPPALGLPCSVTAPGAQITNFRYDQLGRTTRVERPASGYVETRSYTIGAEPGETILETRQLLPSQSPLIFQTFIDGLGRTFRETSPGKANETVVVEREFDDRGRLAGETLPFFAGGASLVREFGYDGLGRLAETRDPDGSTKHKLSYEPWTVIAETEFGAVRQNRKESAVDGLGRLVKVAEYEDPNSLGTSYVVTALYDAADRLVEVRDPVANNQSLCDGLSGAAICQSQDHVTELVWDTMGRRVKIDDPDSGVWLFRYDDAGLLTQRIHNPGASARTQTFLYDELDRLKQRTFSPTGNGSEGALYEYFTTPGAAAFGQLKDVVSSNGTTYHYGYDAAARLDSILQVTAGRGFQSNWVYDELDRVAQRGFPDGEAFSYSYDGTRLSEIAGFPNNLVFTGKVLKTAQFDALGRIDSLEIGEGLGGAPVASVDYGYAPNARLSHILGTPGAFTSDDLDGDGTTGTNEHCPNAYDPGSPDVGGVGPSSSPDGIGDACQCGDVDGNGRVTSADGTAILGHFYSGTPLAMPALCDASGNGSCDFDDYLAVTSALSSPPGNLQNCLPAKPANLPSSAPLYLQVTFDGLGRLTDQTGMLGTEPVSRSYTYDGLSRLKTATGPWEKAAGVTGNVQWTYSYDALGNLRTVRNQPNQNPPARAWSYTDPVRPRLLTGFGQAYQPDETITSTAFGEPATINRSGQSQEQLLWNAQGKLYRDKNSTYSWDAFEQNTLVVTGPSGSQSSIVRVGDDFEYQIQSGHATKYISVGGVRIAALATSYTAFNASLPPALIPTLRRLEPLVAPVATGLLLVSLVSMLGIATRRRPPVWMSAPGVSALSLLLVVLPYQARAATALPGGPGQFGRPAEKFLAYLTDHLGSVRAVVNQNGIVVETRDYDPFGADISHVGAFAVQHRFTGQPADDQAGGLYNYGARFYNAKWGRFISPDQVTEAFDSQGLNPYAYVLNAPTHRVDPTGGDSFAIAPAIPILGGINPTYTTQNDKEVRGEVRNLPLFDLIGQMRLQEDFNVFTLQMSLDALSIVMDLAGAGPFSWVPDGANAVVSASQGDWEGTAMSVAAAIPAAGVPANAAHAARAARKAAKFHLHHPWPKYLGGPVKQQLEKLPAELHAKFHAGLDKILPRRKGTPHYRGLSPAERRQMERDLADYTKAFDAKHETNLYDSLVSNGFPPP